MQISLHVGLTHYPLENALTLLFSPAPIPSSSPLNHASFLIESRCQRQEVYVGFVVTGPGGSRSSSTSSLSSIASEVRAAAAVSTSTPSSPLRHLSLTDSEALFKAPLRDQQQSNNQNNNNNNHHHNNNNLHQNNRLAQQPRKSIPPGKQDLIFFECGWCFACLLKYFFFCVAGMIFISFYFVVGIWTTGFDLAHF